MLNDMTIVCQGRANGVLSCIFELPFAFFVLIWKLTRRKAIERQA